MKQTIDIESAHLRQIIEILQRYIKQPVSVWLFGSRATLTAKKYSDVDLAVDLNSQPMPRNVMADLAYAFEESDLPYKVDIVDWNSIDESFRHNIAVDRVLILSKQ